MTSPPLLTDEQDDPDSGEGRKWVLQGKGEAPDVGLQQGTNTWLAEVRYEPQHCTLARE